MKVTRFLAVVAVAILIGSGIARADSPIQLALWPPDIQLVPVESSVKGLRLNVWGSNAEVGGLDLGFVHETTAQFNGISLGLASINDGEAHGLLWTMLYSYVADAFVGWSTALVSEMDGDVRGLLTGVVNYNEGSATGLELAGLFNYTGQQFTGAQIGLVNRAGAAKGLQLGLVNLADSMQGLQIGLWNQIDAKESWRIIPIVNWQF